MIYTLMKYGRWENLSLTLMYNSIKYMFDLDVEEGGFSNI